MKKKILTDENYYSKDMAWQYMSGSQFKQFGKCEAKTMADLKGDWSDDSDPVALLVGNYVHSYFENKEAHEKFKEENKEKMYSSRKPHGLLKAYQVADDMIERVEREPLFNHIWNGEREVKVTGELYGVEWKGKIDLLNIEKGYFVDLKTTAELGKRFWSTDYGTYVSFIEAYGYDIQIAVYEKLLESKYGKPFTGYIYAVTKENPPNVSAIRIEKTKKEFALERVAENIDIYQDVKTGKSKPTMCGKCDYCRSIKTLDGFITSDDLLE